MDSFRCVHASRLLLDSQLHGTGALAPDVRKIVEDATLAAFEQIVDVCLDREVDCLLLSGDSFDPAAPGLRGPAALVRGIHRLAENDIAVILQVAHPEAWSGWPAGLRLPPNAHRLGPGLETSVSVSREGKLLATIAAGVVVTNSEPDCPSQTEIGWQILLPDDSGNSRVVHLDDAHRGAQGMSLDETGSRGCLLIEFDAGEEPRQTLIPVAPVRWERFEIAVSSEMIRDDLLQNMASLLEQTPREACEKVWFTAWNVTGEGPLIELLADRAFRDELAFELAVLDPVPRVQIQIHALRVHVSAQAARSIAGHDELFAEYVAHIEERFSGRHKALAECLAGSALSSGPWQARIESLIADLDADEIAGDACQMAQQWFAAQGETSS